MSILTTTVYALPSGVLMNVRIEVPDGVDQSPRWWNEVGEAVDTFVYTLCETCGHDVDGHIVTPGPFGHPHLYCEKGEDQ